MTSRLSSEVFFSFLFNFSQLTFTILSMFSCSFFGLWEPAYTGLYALLILVFDSCRTFWQYQAWNQLVLQLLSEFPTERILVC